MRRDLGLALIATAGGLLLWLSGWSAALERPLADNLLRLPRPGRSADAPVAAVVIDEPSLAAHGPLPWPRDRLALLVRGVRDAGAAAVVVDMLLSEPSNTAADRALAEALARGPRALAAVLDGHGGWILPDTSFGGARWAAHAHAESTGDGILRDVAYTKQAAGLALPALSVAAARLAGWREAVVPGATFAPDYRLPPSAVPHCSAAELLDAAAAPPALSGRVVFIGVSAVGAGDQFFTPVGSRVRPSPGVLVHASIAASLIEHGLLHRAGIPAVAALMIASCLAALRWRARRRRLRFLGAVLCFLLLPLVALAVLWAQGGQLPLFSLWCALWAAVALGEAAEIRQAQHEADHILRRLLRLDELPAVQDAETGELPDRLQVVRDLQSRMARQLELRSSLLEGLEEGVVLWDDAGAVLLANAACAELWGHAPTSRDVLDAAGEEGEAAAPTLQVERSGRILELRRSPVAGGTLVVLRDLSQSLELERRRRETQRLVSHELKTPLASISGFGSMLERYELDRDELNRIAALIRGEADRLGAMVSRFLDLERLAAHELDETMDAVDLAAVVRERCRVLSGADGEHARRLAPELPEAPCVVFGAPSLLAELVDNLVGNALKYSPPEAAVAVRVLAPSEQVLLEVEDRGPGIPAESLPRLFESFYRVPGTKARGSGLGLALVKAVADRHRARLQVESELGAGALFRVEFDRWSEGDASESTRPGC